ncbi:Variant-specific surface protein [Giardia duodenalis]|uniref:Variant-specific surface protein n=1 Tax=Giardia intestinalis TaxID=5741 RepID=V6TS75_GIAIN|nr:Variant-specific surface protein [Giardia intestinalis]
MMDEEVRAGRAGAGEARNPRAACTAEESGGAGTCEQCEAPIGQTNYCSKCNEPDTYAPVDGVCVDAGATPYSSLCTAHSNGVCTACGSTSFLYKGGCYQPNEGKPGQSLCLVAKGGVCTEAAMGYFVPTGVTNAEQSVVACDDATGVAVTASSTTYKGVAGCQECAAPDAAPSARADRVATCTRCANPKYLKDSECVADASACGDGYAAKEDSDSGNRCIKCDDANNGGIADCAQCTATASPTRAGAPLVTCSQCSSSKKVRPDKKGCIDTCPANSSDNNGVCVCNSGYVPDETGCTQDTTPQCTTPGCKACDNPAKDNEVCTACNESKYLTPTNQCVDDCGKLGNYYGADDRKCKECTVANCAECKTDGSCMTCRTGFYLDTKECKACDSSCKSCSGATNADCTECPAGKALKYGSDGAKGSCGEGCVVNTTQASGNCKTCGLTVEGTAYCSECATDSEYPQNGVCAGAAGGRAITCTTPGTGVCTTCANGLLKMNGGCYETSRYPGKSVCTEAAQTGGTCQTAAPGYNVNGGTLVTCPEGCSACTSSTACTTCADGYVLISGATTCSKCDASCLTCETSASTCTACASGYYLSGSACTSCESNSGGITGIRGCLSCAAPTGSTGPVFCYLVGVALLTPSPHVPVGMSAVTDRVTGIANPLLGAHMVAERPPRQ